jgi:protease-4
MKRQDLIIGTIIGISILFVFIALLLALSGVFATRPMTFSSLGKRVALVEISGPIYGSRSIVRQLKEYGEDESIPAIVLRIDSPGGIASAAQEIYEKVMEVRQEGKKVVASMGGLAASGGYYVACAADSIIANPASLTGSIGVQMQFANTEQLFKKIGVHFQVVKSGAHKDIGSPHRPMTEEEKRLLQEVIDDTYHQFVDVIVQQRELPEEDVLALADGRIFSGRQAVELGLVDRTGTYEDAIAMAARMAGIKGEPRIVRERLKKVSLFDFLFQMFGKFHDTTRQGAVLEYMLSP